VIHPDDPLGDPVDWPDEMWEYLEGLEDDGDIEEWEADIHAGPPPRPVADIHRPDLFGPVPDGWPAWRPRETDSAQWRRR
jgi:hypothetical protein